jgi:hypothetical protein
MAGLKRRKITSGETRAHGTKKLLDCKCGYTELVDSKCDTVICGLCTQKMLGLPQKKTKRTRRDE